VLESGGWRDGLGGGGTMCEEVSEWAEGRHSVAVLGPREQPRVAKRALEAMLPLLAVAVIDLPFIIDGVWWRCGGVWWRGGVFGGVIQTKLGWWSSPSRVADAPRAKLRGGVSVCLRSVSPDHPAPAPNRAHGRLETKVYFKMNFEPNMKCVVLPRCWLHCAGSCYGE
jgi:hypothetical protein